MPDQLSSDLASLKIDRSVRPKGRSPVGLIVTALLALGAAGAAYRFGLPYLESAVFKTEVEITEVITVSPAQASVELTSTGYVIPQKDTAVACKVETGRAMTLAGLHPATGGTGAEICSGDMLLEALVACAGVTLKAVATALEIPLRKGIVRAEGDLDFRGTLGVDKTAPVGFRAIRLAVELDTDAPPEMLDKLLKLT